MKIRVVLSASALILLLSGCGNPGWQFYQGGMECHLQNKGAACDDLYEKAIENNTMLPGLHSSYAVHLQSEGKGADAQAQFAQELANHPEAKVAIALYQGKQSFGGTTTVEPISKQATPTSLSDTSKAGAQ